MNRKQAVMAMMDGEKVTNVEHIVGTFISFSPNIGFKYYRSNGDREELHSALSRDGGYKVYCSPAVKVSLLDMEAGKTYKYGVSEKQYRLQCGTLEITTTTGGRWEPTVGHYYPNRKDFTEI